MTDQSPFYSFLKELNLDDFFRPASSTPKKSLPSPPDNLPVLGGYRTNSLDISAHSHLIDPEHLASLIKNFSGQVHSPEKFHDSKKGSSLRLYLTSFNSNLANTELHLWSDGFSLNQLGAPHKEFSRSEFSAFTSNPHSFLKRHR